MLYISPITKNISIAKEIVSNIMLEIFTVSVGFIRIQPNYPTWNHVFARFYMRALKHILVSNPYGLYGVLQIGLTPLMIQTLFIQSGY